MDAEQRASLVFDFVDRLLGDIEDGTVRPLHDYLPCYAECEEEVAREYFALLKVPDAEPSPNELRVGPYRLVRQLGRGGQGVVWLAEDSRIDRRVALKMLASPLGAIPTRQRERLRREAEAVSRLDHPGVCPVYEADLTGEVPYVALRWVPGETLASVLARHRAAAAGNATDRPAVASDGEAAAVVSHEQDRPDVPCRPSTPDEVARLTLVFEQVARALHAAHEAGVAHRDVKPGNIMITPDGAPVVLDFGLARQLSDQGAEAQTALTAAGEVFGTLAYMAPEQHGCDPDATVDRRVDVYALGVTLYEALTLQCPYAAESPRRMLELILQGEAVAPRKLHAGIPADLQAVCFTAMAPARDRRYATAADFADDLVAVREGRPVAARPRSASTVLLRRASRHPWTTSATAALLLVSVIALALLRGWRNEAATRQTRHDELVSAQAAFLALRDAHREQRVPDPRDEAIVQRFIPKQATRERQLILGSPLSRDAAELFVRYSADATRGVGAGIEARYPRGTIAEPDPGFRLVGEASEAQRRLAVVLERPGHAERLVHPVAWPPRATEVTWHMAQAMPLAPGHWRWSVRHAEQDGDAAPLASAVFEVVDAGRPGQLLDGLESTGDADLDRELRALALLREGLGAAASDILADEWDAPAEPEARARRLLLSAWAAGLLGRYETVERLRVSWLELRGRSGR